MRVVLQKVSGASVSVDGTVIGSIQDGYVLLACILANDTEDDARRMAQKIAAVRLFPGEDGKINDRSLLQAGGGALVISQFTLAGKLEKGNRPDYTAAAEPKEAERLYEFFIQALRDEGVQRVEHGKFRSMMSVSLVNEGPVTLIVDL